MRIALAQLNPTIGDVAGNTRLVLDAIEEARTGDAEVLITPELMLLGYPPRDLILREGVVEACEEAVAIIAAAAGDLAVIVGHPRRDPDGVRGVRNSASVCTQGEVIAICDKRLLPGYDVFDEDRYFDPGRDLCAVDLPCGRIGVLICEDIWRAGDVDAECRYPINPLRELSVKKCDVILSLNASPFVIGKFDRHRAWLQAEAKRNRMALIAVNQVGANDDLIFDGRSFAVNAQGEMIALLDGWTPAVETIELHDAESAAREKKVDEAIAAHHAEPFAEIYHALVLGVRDYCHKTRNDTLVLGLSGGIDSALTAVLAAAALGPESVMGVMLPSRYTSDISRRDALELADRLRLPTLLEIPIEPGHHALETVIGPALGESLCGIADENVQARLRGVILMALTNARGGLLLSTSNKSELAMGYSTLYGDMCGALAPLGDLTKSRLYQLANWINAQHKTCGFDLPPIPESSINRLPTAELRPNQTDQDTLPPYPVLDEIIERFVDQEHSVERIARATGFDADLVQRTARSIDRAEFKRHQSTVILKVMPRAFGRGRPMPIVMKATRVEESSAIESPIARISKV